MQMRLALVPITTALAVAAISVPTLARATISGLRPLVAHHAPARTMGSWMAPQAKSAKQLVYVANGSLATVDVYSVSGSSVTHVGQLTGFNDPEGMTTDAQGNLYVVDDFVPQEGPVGGQVLVFKKGATNASRTINPNPWVPFDVAVDAKGTMYIANIAPIAKFSPGSVSVYGKKNDNKPLRILRDAAFSSLDGIAVDPATSDTYVSYGTPNGSGRLASFADGRGTATDLGVSFGPPWGVVLDGSGHVLVCDGNGPVDIYPTGGGSLLGTIAVPGTAEFAAFNSDRSLLYVTTFGNHNVEIFSYPSGSMVGSFEQGGWSNNAWPTGIAYWPPTPPRH